MVVSADEVSQYNSILRKLKDLNPGISIEMIKSDIEQFLLQSFLEEIGKRDLSLVSYSKIRMDFIKQKLQSKRQPQRLRTFKDGKIKKETKLLKFKRIQNSLHRKEFYDTLDYPGTFGREELFYINHTDKSYQKNLFKHINEDKNQERYQNLREKDRSNDEKISTLIEPNNSILYEKIELPEIQETVDIFKNVDIKKDKIEEVKKKVDLEQNTKDRILSLDLKPIKKEHAEDINLLDYIGFIDEDQTE